MRNDPNLSETELKEIEAEFEQVRGRLQVLIVMRSRMRRSMLDNASTQVVRPISLPVGKRPDRDRIEDDDESMTLLVSPSTTINEIDTIHDGGAGQLVETATPRLDLVRQPTGAAASTTAIVTANATASATASNTGNAAASASSLIDISEAKATNSGNPTQDARKLPSNRNSFAGSLAAVTLSTNGIASELKQELDAVAKTSSNQDANTNRNSFAPGSIAIHCEDNMSVMTGDDEKERASLEEFVNSSMRSGFVAKLEKMATITEDHYALGKDTNDKVQRCEKLGEECKQLLQVLASQQGKQQLTKTKKPVLRAVSSSEMNRKQPSLNFYAKKPPTIPKGPGCLERAQQHRKPKFKKDDGLRGWQY